MSATPLGVGAQPSTDPQLAAALAARAKMERLLTSPTPFSDDDGSAAPAVTAALENTRLPRHEYLDALWAALTASRVILPVAAHARAGATGAAGLGVVDDAAGASGVDGVAGRAGVDGAARAAGGTRPERVPSHPVHTNDAAQDAATLAVSLPDGHIALPVFTSAEAMAAWRRDVRPVPVEPRRAAQVAVGETDQLWVLDPGTRDLRLPRPAVLALAGGQAWVPSWRNEPVQAEVAAQLGAVDGVTAVAFEPGESAELRVLLRIDPSGGIAGVAAIVEACQMVMVNPAWGELIDTVELCPLPG